MNEVQSVYDVIAEIRSKTVEEIGPEKARQMVIDAYLAELGIFQRSGTNNALFRIMQVDDMSQEFALCQLLRQEYEAGIREIEWSIDGQRQPWSKNRIIGKDAWDMLATYCRRLADQFPTEDEVAKKAAAKVAADRYRQYGNEYGSGEAYKKKLEAAIAYVRTLGPAQADVLEKVMRGAG